MIHTKVVIIVKELVFWLVCRGGVAVRGAVADAKVVRSIPAAVVEFSIETKQQSLV